VLFLFIVATIWIPLLSHCLDPIALGCDNIVLLSVWIFGWVYWNSIESISHRTRQYGKGICTYSGSATYNGALFHSIPSSYSSWIPYGLRYDTDI
jgi:hypothetical protein